MQVHFFNVFHRIEWQRGRNGWIERIGRKVGPSSQYSILKGAIFNSAKTVTHKFIWNTFSAWAYRSSGQDASTVNCLRQLIAQQRDMPRWRYCSMPADETADGPSNMLIHGLWRRHNNIMTQTAITNATASLERWWRIKAYPLPCNVMLKYVIMV